MWISNLLVSRVIITHLFRNGGVSLLVLLAIWVVSIVCRRAVMDWLSVLFVLGLDVFSVLAVTLSIVILTAFLILLLAILLRHWLRCLSLFLSSLPALWSSFWASFWGTTTPKCFLLFSSILWLDVARSCVLFFGLESLSIGTTTSVTLFLWSVLPMLLLWFWLAMVFLISLSWYAGGVW